MNRTERLAAILMLLQARRRTAGELAGHFEVSRRTILRDVQALCEMGVPVISEDGQRGGYQLVEGYSLPPLQLTLPETFLLLLSLSAVGKLADSPFRPERASLEAKIRALIPAPHLPEVEALLERVSIDVPERAYELPGIETLIRSACDSRWLRIAYRSERGPSDQRILPRAIYSYGGYWYCRAYSHERQEERIYRVDRMADLEPVEPPGAPLPDAAARPYHHPSHPEVAVRLTPRGVLRVERDPQLGGAVQPEPDGGGLLRFRCPPPELDWYARFFFGFGLDAEVLAPPELGARIRGFLSDLFDRYRER